jgi:Protein of unknown function (DUF2934)
MEEDSKLKSKEPKQPKEKKNEAKSRKSKGNRGSAQAPLDAEVMPQVAAADEVIEHAANGTGDPHAVTIEPVAVEVDPPQEMIRMRAYDLFVDRGCEHGRHLEDWLAAERELKVKHRAV